MCPYDCYVTQLGSKKIPSIHQDVTEVGPQVLLSCMRFLGYKANICAYRDMSTTLGDICKVKAEILTSPLYHLYQYSVPAISLFEIYAHPGDSDLRLYLSTVVELDMRFFLLQ
jgi:hypothetical protein